ncbi:MAG: hypothetical protein ACI8P3_001141 [Saprospiraceae bacterium]|jgi:hypothetical protein
MSKIFTAFFFVIFLATCENNPDSNKPQNTTVLIKPAAKIIAPLLLDKANISLTEISQKDFEAIPYQDADFRKSKQLCEQSKGYNANQWEGLNECSWAIEQEKINAHQEVVSRKDKELILKTTTGEISIKHNTKASTGATYYRFKDFIPTSNYYLVEEIISGQCLNSSLISGIDGSPFNFKGLLTPSPDGRHFIVHSLNPTGTTNCSNKLAYYETGDEGILKKWHIPLQNHRIQDLKLVGDHEVYLALLNNSDPAKDNDYIKITLSGGD